MKRCLYLVVILSILALSLSSCKTNVPDGMTEIKLFFSNSEKNSLVIENAYIKSSELKNTSTLVKAVMKKLFSGPSDSGHIAVIPKGVYLRGVSERKDEPGCINIDLSNKYYDFSSTDEASSELLARYSIVSTLCQFDKIKKVKMYVNGADMLGNSGYGEVVEEMGNNNILINSPSSVETKTEKFVTLYFTDKEKEKLYPETRKATMSDNSLEKTVVSELIRGPVSNGYERTFSENVELISVETTEGVCFVNFSPQFISGFSSNGKEEKIAVYSVVNSLTKLPGIEKVQLLIDGKKPDSDIYQLFNTQLSRDETFIENGSSGNK